MELIFNILLTANLAFLGWVGAELISIKVLLADFGRRIGLLEGRKQTKRKNTPCLS